MKHYFLYFIGSVLGLTIKLTALDDIDELNAQILRNFHQPYDSSLNFIELQKSLSEYDCVFGVPINIYDPKITPPQGCHVLLLKHPQDKKQIKVVFKPRNKLIQKLSVGAFYTAQYLGMDTTIPPLSPYIYEGNPGLVSYFIDTDLNNLFLKISKNHESIKKHVCPKSLSDYYVLSYLLGNWDLKWKNALLINNQGIVDVVCVDIDAIAYPGHGDYGAHFFVPWIKSEKDTIPYSSFSKEDTFYMQIKDVDAHLDQLFPLFESRKEIQNEVIMSQKYALVSQKAKSYTFWKRPPVKHHIDKKAWWINLYEGSDHAVPPFTEFADKHAIEHLKALDIDILKILFNDLDPEKPIVNEEFYIGILARRDAMCQILQEF